MLLTYGTKFVGKVDRIPGEAYSVCRVVHLAEVPLFPLEGHRVLEGTESKTLFGGVKAFRGWPTSTRWKAFAWAWARILLFWLGLALLLGLLPLFLTLLGFRERFFEYPLGFGLGCASFAALWLTRKGLRCDAARVEALRARVGPPDDLQP